MSFDDFLSNHGFTDLEIILDGKIHRNKSDARWYKGSINYTSSGKEWRSLTIGDWRVSNEPVGYFNELKDSPSNSFSPQDIEEMKLKTEELKRQELEERKINNERARTESLEIYNKAKAPGNHPYLSKKQIDPEKISTECKFIESENGPILILPMYSETYELQGLQKIYMDGTKRFIKGQRKKGCFGILKGTNKSATGITEGFATAYSIREATGLDVYISFDAGNLQEVAKLLRRKHNDKKIIIFGDDDIHGKINVGRVAATEAANEVGGSVIFPCFNSKTMGEFPGLTDWNDKHVREGLHSCKTQIDSCGILNDEPSARPRVADDSLASDEERDESIESEDQSLNETAIKFLGFIEGKHHYISQYSKKVVSLSPQQHAELSLLELMPLYFWDSKYSEYKVVIKNGVETFVKSPIKWNHAADWLMGNSLKNGYFDAGRIRGSGLFVDEGRVVLNSGNVLVVDGVEVNPTNFKSEYIYTPGPRINYKTTAASVNECSLLLDVANHLLWSKKEEAYFFVGWLVCAVLGGSLKWRPHLYITGPAGIGKSWVFENIAYAMVREFSEFFLSNSTEAGIRQAIKSNSLAVIWDEPEVNNLSDNKAIQKVLALARQSSFESDGRVSKGTASGNAMEFSIKSCFLLGSIKDAIQEGADLTRFTILNLTKIEDKEESLAHFDKLEKMVFDLTDNGFPIRFAKMVCSRVHEFEANNSVLKKVISRKYNSRVAQQYAALLAGYWLVSSDSVISAEMAEELSKAIEKQDTVSDVSNSDISECFDYLRSKLIVVDAAEGNSGSVRMTIGEILDKPFLHDRLEAFGIRVVDKNSVRDGMSGVFVAYKNPQLNEVFRDTKWCSGWGRSLAKIPNSKRVTQRISGVVTKGILVPFEKNEDCPF